MNLFLWLKSERAFRDACTEGVDGPTETAPETE